MSEREPRWTGEPGESPTELTTVTLGLLRKGPAWQLETTPEVLENQKRHLALLQRLGNAVHLLIAGPVAEGDGLRGIVVFRADSLEEARALMADDPHLASGRLVLDLYPWTVPSEVLRRPLLEG